MPKVGKLKRPETEKSMVPAYVAFKTFVNFVDGFSGDGGLPDHIDKSLMPTMSGGLQNHLVASLKFLNLIFDDGKTSAEFRQLVNARGTDKWRECLRELIDLDYDGIVDSKSISKLTPKKLQDSFRAAGATGSTNTRAIRFYLSAMKECGVDVPKHLEKAPASLRDGKPAERKSAKKAREKPARKPSDESPELPEGLQHLPVPLGGGREGFIYYPDDIAEDECGKYEAAIVYLRALVK